MNRKTLLISTVILLVGLAIWFFFFRQTNTGAEQEPVEQTPELATLSALIAQNPGNDTLLYRRAQPRFPHAPPEPGRLPACRALMRRVS